MNIVFLGTPEFAVSSLNALLNDSKFNVLAVVTQPDAVVGRKKILTFPPVKKLALEHNIPVFQPNSKKELYDMVSKINDVDFFVVVAFGMILRQEVLDLPKFGTLNVHGSVLPKYRGPSPIHYSLLNGDKVAGASLMLLDAEMDHGPVFATSECEVFDNDDFLILYSRIANLGADLLVDSLPKIFNGSLISLDQNHSNATYCKMIKKEDGFVDFSLKSRVDVLNMIRAFSQWPNVYIDFCDLKLKIVTAELFDLKIDFSGVLVGSLFEYDKNLFLKCFDGVLKINSVQVPSKNVVDYRSFLNGFGKNIIHL